MRSNLAAALGVEERERALRVLEPVAGKLEATEALIRSRLASDVPFVASAGEYLFAAGGKRMRPALLLLCAQMLGHDSEEEVTYAAAVEFIHAATLVHDDIIDHSELRRGRRTVHSVWGSNMTVLLGDWLYATALRMALEHGNTGVIDLFCHATLRMTEGELLVLGRLGAPDLASDEYFDIIDRKTAALFAAACAAPGLMRPEKPEIRQALATFGQALGICFQLVDDLLDITGSEDELGKPVLSDLREGKLTLPLLLALPRLAPAERARVDMVLADRDFARVSRQEILDLVAREGTVEEVIETARLWASRASGALAVFPENDSRRALAAAPELVLRRHA